MRICVVHLISFFILVIPLLMNTYFLVKNFQTHNDLGETFSMSSTPIKRAIKSMVKQSIASRMKKINSDLRNIKSHISQNADTSRCRSNLCGSLCNTSHLVNYADEKLGASIKKVRASPVDRGQLSSMVGMDTSKNPPINLLRSDMRPGNCFAFSRSKAEVEIHLAKEVYVTMIELEHIPKCRSPSKDISSAPKDFKVFGICPQSGNKIHLGDFVFSNKSPCEKYRLKVGQRFQILILIFSSNHGNQRYTCVYRVAVYGHT